MSTNNSTSSSVKHQKKPSTSPNNINKLALNAHFLWFVGHFLTFGCTALHSIVSIFRPFSPTAQKYYSLTIYSVILSYSIVLFKTYSLNTLAKTLFSNPFAILKNSNALYLFLSGLFLANHGIIFEKIQLSLYSFAIYSLFHSINYLNQSILSSTANKPYQTLKSKLSQFSKQYYEPSLYMAANCELFVMIHLIFTDLKNLLMIFQTNPLTNIRILCITILYLVFLKLRYDDSHHMKAVVQSYDLRINQFLYSNQRIPQAVTNIWFKFRTLIGAYVAPIRIEARHR
ncbi:hypothetical protein DASC09_057960 [Saccharomycopsis crataegensis]|uniref:Uncharacterized protein n=1 Tax=Saccharomycopsis crataegensis TaxID=43959 RepID=A0AAV5QU65_9ASCO|nr:hypothetical protein DASC09_057960 [Saccharomycopsis crataegensis]